MPEAVLALAAIGAITAAPGGAAAAHAGGRCLVPGTDRTIDHLWRPDMTAAAA